MSDPHEMVSMADLLVAASITDSEAKAWGLIYHGKVQIEQWTIGIAEGTLPRWVLRGVTITVGERSIRISDDGSKILRSRTRTLEHA